MSTLNLCTILFCSFIVLLLFYMRYEDYTACNIMHDIASSPLATLLLQQSDLTAFACVNKHPCSQSQ